MKELLDMFWAFFRIGGLTFGGGYAMLPMLQREVVERYKWATEDELLDYYAVGQCTPGIIAVNTATFIGYKRRGYLGAAVATFGVVAPSLVIIMAIAAFIQNIQGMAVVAHAFAGIRVAVSVLVLTAIVKLWKGSVVDGFTTAVFVLFFLLATFTSIPPVAIVVLAALGGIVVKVLLPGKGEKKDE